MRANRWFLNRFLGYFGTQFSTKRAELLVSKQLHGICFGLNTIFVP